MSERRAGKGYQWTIRRAHDEDAADVMTVPLYDDGLMMNEVRESTSCFYSAVRTCCSQ
jgi:hypothetical protein